MANKVAGFWSYLPVALVLATVWVQSIALGQTSTLKLDTGKEIWDAACAGCHGPDGKGLPESTLGFEPPPTFPDFSDCNSSSREPNLHWSSMIHEGGAARGFSPIMPSFGQALSDDQINKLLGYVRTFCADSAWPQGDLNLPRPLYTEKAFPEDETVLITGVNATQQAAVENRLVYEKRFGARNNFELIVPANYQKQPSGSWFAGIGDVTLEVKRAMWHSMNTGSIFSLAGELTLPTGDARRGLGAGVTQLEAFAAFGQLLPWQSFVQTQLGLEGPYRRGQIPSEAFWRTAVGKTFSQNRWGRSWSPMLEVISARELLGGEKIEWDISPQVQVTLNRRQHLRANLGVRFPVANTGNRAVQVAFYLLWDWFDGGLKDGWR
jgi:mono/diheme cytochrome c family protein